MRLAAFAAWAIAAIAATGVLSAEAKLLVTVVDSKTGEVVSDLKASDFAVQDRGSPREVLAAEFSSKPVDAALLVDASQVMSAQSIAPGLIDQLGPKEQMSVVAFSTTPDLIQEFTSNKDLLKKAIDKLRFGSDPDVVGAVYASADTDFKSASSHSLTERHVILLVSPGKDFGGRVSPEATIKMARKNSVSVYLISPRGYSKWIEELAKQTGGAAFNVQEIAKTLKDPGGLGDRIFGAVRGNYTLTMAGNLALGELKIEVSGKRKVSITSRPLD